MAKKRDFLYTEYSIHILVWVLYMLYETLLTGVLFDNFGNPIIYLSHYAIVIIFFYIHANKSLPFALNNKMTAVLLVPIIIIMELFFYCLAQFVVTFLLAKIELTTSVGKSFDKPFILRNIYRGTLFFGFSTGYYFLRNYLTQRKKTEELEKERLQSIIEQQKITQELMLAENAFLKAQINPHFLFNTLDFIYHKVNRHSEVAGEAIVKLAEMMRFAIDTDEKDGSAMLAKEIEQVENLIYLYQIRKSQPLNVYFAYSPAVKQLRLIPLILLTLMENIFKHGDLSNADDIAVLNLDILNEQLLIETTNLIAIKQATHSNNSGLANIEKRLNYAYGDAVTFNYHIGHRHFSLKITIPLKLVDGSSSPTKPLNHNGK